MVRGNFQLRFLAYTIMTCAPSEFVVVGKLRVTTFHIAPGTAVTRISRQNVKSHRLIRHWRFMWRLVFACVPDRFMLRNLGGSGVKTNPLLFPF